MGVVMSLKRMLRLGTRLAVAALTTAVVFAVSMRAYVEYKVHRAMAMLAVASRVQVGDTEATVLPLVKRYRGFKWTPDPLGARENWVDKDEYDYEKNLVSDYVYSFEVSPYRLLEDTHSGVSRITRAIRAPIDNAPLTLRSLIGMRDWGAEVDVAIRGGRVQTVSAMVLAEGRSRWLGHAWKFLNAMPNRELQTRAFVVNSAHLDMQHNDGDLTENIFTPRATSEELRVSRTFNVACLTSLRGCDGLCDFVPRTLDYLKDHPDAAGNIFPEKCSQ